jgi:hypothetical protein
MAVDRYFLLVRALSSGATRIANLRTAWSSGVVNGVSVSGGSLYTLATSAPLPVVHVAYAELTLARGRALREVIPHGTTWELIDCGELEAGEDGMLRAIPIVHRILVQLAAVTPLVAP